MNSRFSQTWPGCKPGRFFKRTLLIVCQRRGLQTWRDQGTVTKFSINLPARAAASLIVTPGMASTAASLKARNVHARFLATMAISLGSDCGFVAVNFTSYKQPRVRSKWRDRVRPPVAELL